MGTFAVCRLIYLSKLRSPAFPPRLLEQGDPLWLLVGGERPACLWDREGPSTLMTTGVGSGRN